MTQDPALNARFKRVVVATFQTGCANNLALLARAIVDMGREVTILCAGASCRVYARAGLPFTELPQELGRAEADEMLARLKPDLMITGSNGANKFDFNLRLAARDDGIPVATLLDYWGNYERRFRDLETGLESMPDMLLVADEMMRDGVLGAGVPARTVRIVGNPHFENMARAEAAPRGRDDRPWKRLLFASQPLGGLFGSDDSNPRYLGYDEFDAFAALKTYVGERSDVKLYVKPHPREDDTGWMRALAGLDRERVRYLAGRGHPFGLMRSADAVVGMTTNMLIEACVVGRPSVSIQPGARDRELFFGTVSGLVPTAFDAQALARLLDDALAGTLAHEDPAHLYSNAMARCLGALNDL